MPDWTQITAAVAGAGSALAGAVAAGAAWRSAAQSSAAARDVRDALGLAIKPSIDARPVFETRVVGGAEPVQVHGVVLTNDSLWSAVDVEIESVLHNGQTYSKRIDRLDGAEDRKNPSRMTVDLSDAPPPEVTGPGVTEVGEQNLENVVRVRYSDERRLLRWEFTHTTSMLYRFDGRIMSQGGQPSRSERSLTLRH